MKLTNNIIQWSSNSPTTRCSICKMLIEAGDWVKQEDGKIYCMFEKFHPQIKETARDYEKNIKLLESQN